MNISNELLSSVTIYSKYSRYLPSKNRRETWEEIVNRNKAMHLKKYPKLREEIEANYKYVLDKKVLPSLRGMQFGGKPIEISNTRQYNCGYIPIDHYRAFDEIAFLLLGGSGIGFSVQHHHVEQLPPVVKPTKKRRYLIGDSIEGWSESIKALMKAYLCGKSLPVFDFRDIRPRGRRLITSGGIAPGPEPLKDCLHNIQKVLDRKADGEKLRPIECHDVVCHIADCILAGGIRRSATLSLFDHDNYEMTTCLSYHSMVRMASGELRSISDIVRTKSTDKVISFDPVTQSLVHRSITGWYEFSYSGKWYRVVTKHTRRGKKYQSVGPDLTPDHKVLTMEGWKEVQQLIPGKDTIATCQYALSTTERQCILGSLLGDGSIAFSPKACKTKRFQVGHCAKQQKYLLYKQEILKTRNPRLHFRKTETNIIGNNTKTSTTSGFASFYISQTNEVNDIYDILYRYGNKLISREYLNLLDAGSLAFWYMDDGYLQKQKYAVIYIGKNHSIDECNCVKDWLWDKFGIDTVIYDCDSASCYMLKFNSKSSPHFFDIIAKYVHPSMEYKLPKEHRGRFSMHIDTPSSPYYDEVVDVIEVTLPEWKAKKSYCIDVDGTHNFCTTTLVAHNCKYNSWWEHDPQRARANNSALLMRDEITEEQFFELWKKIEASGSGEPGFYWSNSRDMGINACQEASLEKGGLCNLTTMNASDVHSQTELNNRAKCASFIGTLQAGYTDFHYVRELWQARAEKDALLGVSMTGIASGGVLGLSLSDAANIVLNENERVAELIGINKGARNTITKPEGTSSCVLGCSSGIHPYHAPFYIRRMRLLKTEPLYYYIAETLPDLVEDDFLKPQTQAVLSLPQKAPEGSIYRTESPLKLLERIKHFTCEWIKPGHRSGANTHSVSATVSIKDKEWDRVGKWMWENKDYYNGLSVIPFDIGSYRQPPFEDCDEETYNSLMKKVRKIDLSNIVEEEDTTKLREEVACSGGACTVTQV